MKACLKELVAKARLLPMESDYLEFVLDESPVALLIVASRVSRQSPRLHEISDVQRTEPTTKGGASSTYRMGSRHLGGTPGGSGVSPLYGSAGTAAAVALPHGGPPSWRLWEGRAPSRPMKMAHRWLHRARARRWRCVHVRADQRLETRDLPGIETIGGRGAACCDRW